MHDRIFHTNNYNIVYSHECMHPDCQAGLCDPCVTMGKLEEAAGRVQPPQKGESNPEKLSLALERSNQMHEDNFDCTNR